MPFNVLSGLRIRRARRFSSSNNNIITVVARVLPSSTPVLQQCARIKVARQKKRKRIKKKKKRTRVPSVSTYRLRGADKEPARETRTVYVQWSVGQRVRLPVCANAVQLQHRPSESVDRQENTAKVVRLVFF